MSSKSSSGSKGRSANKGEQKNNNNGISYFYIALVPLLIAVSAALHRLDMRPFFLFSVLVFMVCVVAIPIFNRNMLAVGVFCAMVIIFGGVALDTFVIPKDLVSFVTKRTTTTPPSPQETAAAAQHTTAEQQQQETTTAARQEEEEEEEESEEEGEALEFSDLRGVTFIPEKMHNKMGLSTQTLKADFDVERANINLLERWIDVNATVHLLVAQLKEPTITSGDARLYNFPAFFMKTEDDRGLLIIGPNNRRFEKFVTVKDGNFKIRLYEDKMEAQSIAEAYHYLRDAMNAAEREMAEGQQEEKTA